MEYEKALLDSIENDEWKSVTNKSAMIQTFKQTARNTMIKDQRMNVRISKRDLLQLKSKAMEEGIPYQTLVTSIIHKYITGGFKEITHQ
jgi:predicted DNA binding CopG/RHH family protein